jgi:hypothetical protein
MVVFGQWFRSQLRSIGGESLRGRLICASAAAGRCLPNLSKRLSTVASFSLAGRGDREQFLRRLVEDLSIGVVRIGPD